MVALDQVRQLMDDQVFHAPRRVQPAGQQTTLPVEDYRHPEATRPNNPPAAIAAEGRTPPAPRITYAYSPRLAPALRADPSGKADALPPLLEKATRESRARLEAIQERLSRFESQNSYQPRMRQRFGVDLKPTLGYWEL